jgi:hemerythrin-like domain-containing protein
MKTNPMSQSGLEKNKQRLIAQARARHDELLEAIYRLELALASAAPRRDRVWHKRVIEELEKASDLLDEHFRSIEADDGLLSMIVSAQPRLAHGADRVGREHSNLVQQARSLEGKLAHHEDGDVPSFRDVCDGLRSLLNALSNHRADANDLVFEAFSTDIGIGD